MKNVWLTRQPGVHAAKGSVPELPVDPDAGPEEVAADDEILVIGGGAHRDDAVEMAQKLKDIGVDVAIGSGPMPMPDQTLGAQPSMVASKCQPEEMVIGNRRGRGRGARSAATAGAANARLAARIAALNKLTHSFPR